MIVLKTSRELSLMRKAGKISQTALKLAGEAVEPGVSTWEIDKIVRQYIEKMGAVPSFLGYGGFPASACISVNDVVIHGIPSKSIILKKGDIVGIDIGACYEGFHGDNAWTFPCGEVSEEAKALLDATEKGLFLGIEQARPGNRLGDIGHAEMCIRDRGKATRGNKVTYGDYGLQALEPAWITSNQIEAARVAMTRYTKRCV